MIEVLEKKKILFLFLLLLLASLLSVALFFNSNLTVQEVISFCKEVIEATIIFLQKEAWLLFLGIAILPTFLFPVSPLMIVSGTVFANGENAPIAFLLALSAAAINMAWTYWVAAGPCHVFISKILSNTKFKIPKASGKNNFKLVAIVRLTGMPFPFQNFTLGMSHMNFTKYMLFSLIVQAPILCAFVYFGDAITQGKGKVLFLAIAVIVIVSLVSRFIPKYLKNRKNAITASG